MEQEQVNTSQGSITLAQPIYKPRVFSILDKTWESAKGKIWQLIGLDLLMILAMMVAIIVAGVPSAILVAITFAIKVPALTVLFGAIGIIAILAMLIWVGLWSMIASLKILQSEPTITVRTALVEARPLVSKFYLTGVVASLVIIGGFLLFIIPGIIALVSLYLVLYVAVIENKTGMEALTRSRDLVKGRWWSVALVLLGFVIIALAVMMVTGGNGGGSPIMIILTPISYVFGYVLYKELSDNYNSQPNSTPWFYKLFMIFAIAVAGLGLIGGMVAAGSNWDKFYQSFESRKEFDEEQRDFKRPNRQMDFRQKMNDEYNNTDIENDVIIEEELL